MLEGDMRRAVRPAEVEARLRPIATGRRHFKAVLVVQIDTASGVVNDIAAIGEAIRAAGHDALSWWTRSPRSPAWRSRWTTGASTSRCRDRRRA